MTVQRVQQLIAAGDYAALDAMFPYTAFVGLETRPRDGSVVTTLRTRASNMGNTVNRAVHGGVVGALLEHAAFMQLIFDSATGRMPKIVNLSIDYLRPVPCDRDTHARGTVIRQGRRVANVRIEAWQEDPSRPLAAANAHFITG